MKNWIMIFALLIGFGTTAIYAQGNHRQIHRPQAGQQFRIHQGVRNGEINRWEARGLQRQQMHNRQLRQMAKADGKITRAERRLLRKANRNADRNIRRKRNNCR